MKPTAPSEGMPGESRPPSAAEPVIAAGYLHPGYAESLREFGHPRHLARSGGWILERSIPGSGARDAMGCYPLFCCRDWSQLPGDLDAIGQDLVSLVLVTDPFGRYTVESLRAIFPDRMRPFKDHFVVNLGAGPEEFVHGHHQRNARKALRVLQVERASEPAAWLEEWSALYATLVARHAIRGIARFSRDSFALALRVPGMELFRAVHDQKTVGMTLWYMDGNTAYYHLAAYDELGYELGASFALFWEAFAYFAKRGVRQVGLGAGAGATGDRSDGLTRFKRGWANETRPTFLCGKIFDPEKYRALTEAKRAIESDYFPAYRTGEFIQERRPE